MTASLAACTTEIAQRDAVVSEDGGTLSAPDAPARPHEILTHGHSRVDDYYWLRDDSRSDPEVLAYLEAENAYLDTVLAPVAELRGELYREMVARLKEDEASVPVRIGDYWYSSRYRPGEEYRIYLRSHGSEDAPEAVILDANERAAGHDYYQLGKMEVSDDHLLLAFAEDTVSRRLYTIRIKDLQSGELLPDAIPDTSSAMAWSADGQYLFYVRRHPETLLPYQVWRHRLGTPVDQDHLVYEEADDTFYTTLYRGKSGDWIYLQASHTVMDEVRLIDARDPLSEPVVFLPRERGHEYSVADIDGRFFVQSNWQAENFRLLETDLANRQQRSDWREVVAHRQDALIHDFDLFADFIVVNERREGLRRLRILPMDGGPAFDIESGDPAYAMYLDDNERIDTSILRYAYSSLTTPTSIYDYDMRSGQRVLRKREPVLGDFDPADYASERLSITAADGAEVPVSLVYRKPFAADGRRPLLVYGYGAYGSSRDPSFSSGRLSLLDRGFVYAIAHLRGGQELGRRWYDAGRMFNKKNTFTDFIDVTRGLIEQGYGDAGQVYAYGGSAGGLLMGAVVNMAPELYRGVVAAVPFVDVVTTMLDESIPLTTGEFDEWGNPKIREQYDYMLSYSPYDQVRSQAYPNLLVTTGLHDSQVQYWEPAKWVARLRDRKTDDNTLLLYTDMASGHGGASGRYQAYEDIALRWAFLLWLAGIEE